MIKFGVDPGKDGAIACEDDCGKVTVVAMPMISGPVRPGKARLRVYDIDAIDVILADHDASVLWIEDRAMFPMVQPTCRYCQVPCVCPKCHIRAPKTKNATAAASQAICHTWFEALCRHHGITFKVVPAQTWQKVMLNPQKGDDRKALSIAWAQRKYPNVSLLPTERCRKPSHGFSDALAVMEFGSRATVVA